MFGAPSPGPCAIQAGPDRGGGRRDLLPGRSGRPLAGPPGQAPAGSPGARAAPDRGNPDPAGPGPLSQRHEPRPGAGDRARRLPRRPLLSAQDHRGRSAAAARAAGRSRPSWTASPPAMPRRWAGPRSASPRARWSFFRYAWPGNVRELQNEVQSAVILCGEDGIVLSTFRPSSSPSPRAPRPPRPALFAEAKSEFIRRFLRQALERCDFNKARTAASIGLSRQGLFKLIKRHGLAEAGGPAEGKVNGRGPIALPGGRGFVRLGP